MGTVVTTPTPGVAGIMMRVLVVLLDLGISGEAIVSGPLTVAAFDLVIVDSGSISGAAGEFQTEIGSATSMVAAAVDELFGDTATDSQCRELDITNSLGLVCDCC